jgi:hypothetical protein
MRDFAAGRVVGEPAARLPRDASFAWEGDFGDGIAAKVYLLKRY